MTRDQITSQCTYKTATGKLLYVQDVTGQKVTYCVVGDVERHERSLGFFASHVVEQVPNQ